MAVNLESEERRAVQTNAPDAWHALAEEYARRGWVAEAVAAGRRALRAWADGAVELAGSLERAVDLLVREGLVQSAMALLREHGPRLPQSHTCDEGLAELTAKHPPRSVSVFTPCYNAAATIGRCIRSVSAQTYPIAEYIIVDDASTDDSVEVLERLGRELGMKIELEAGEPPVGLTPSPSLLGEGGGEGLRGHYGATHGPLPAPHLPLRGIPQRTGRGISGARGDGSDARDVIVLRVIRHAANAGLGAACNTALAHSSSEFLAKVDADVDLDPTWLERAMSEVASDARVAAVAGQLFEAHTATLADRWRATCMPQHHGPQRVVNPRIIFGADGLFRAEALRAVGGWDPRCRESFDDLDITNKLRAAGHALVYTPLARARHLRRDEQVGKLVRNCWKWHYLPHESRGAYERLSAAASCLGANATIAKHYLNGTISMGAMELSYPGFLCYYAFAARDLEQVRARGGAEADAVAQTAVGLYLVARSHLHRSDAIPPRVVERTLRDLRECLEPLLRVDDRVGATDRADLADEDALDRLLPASAPPSPQTIAQLAGRGLPRADMQYLNAFAGHPFLTELNAVQGRLIEISVRAIEHEEQREKQRRASHEHEVPQEDRDERDDRGADREHDDSNQPAGKTCVIFNPSIPAPLPAGAPPPQTMRWMDRSRVETAARRLRESGARVFVIDSMHERLDERQAHERVLGINPALVIYWASSPVLENCVRSARYLKLVANSRARLVLLVRPGQLEAARQLGGAWFDAIERIGTSVTGLQPVP